MTGIAAQELDDPNRTPTLRPYQECGVANTRAQYAAGVRRVLYTAPTGSGKTVLFAHVVHGAVARGNTVCILGHRDEIVLQICDALSVLGVEHGVIAASEPETDAPVQVASVATLVRRLDRMQRFDLLVVDEAHHAVAGSWRKIIAALPDAFVLGVTATPERLDGAGLRDVFETLVLGPSVGELVAGGYLSQFTAYTPEHGADLSGVRDRAGDYAIEQLADAMGGVVIGGAVDEYERLCPGVPAIAFCVNREHSRLVAARFCERGYRAAHIDGEATRDERRALIEALGSGELHILCNCGLISEGLDVPCVEAAILLRPTRSLALYLQQVGRALRPAPGKTGAVILDHAGNCLRHGLPDMPRAWSLDGRAAKASKMAGDPAAVRCDNCGAANRPTKSMCGTCGTQLRVPKARPEIRSSALVKAEAGMLRALSYGRALAWAGTDEARLRIIAATRGYRRGWVWHRLQEGRRAEGGNT